MEEITILLADDHVLVREGTRELLDNAQGLKVIAEAGDGEEAVKLAALTDPDIIIIDIEMPKLNGIEATKQIKANAPDAVILILTAYDDDQYIFALLEAGAAGYLLKDVSSDELIKAVRAVYAGDSVLHPTITRKVVNYFGQQTDKRDSQETKVTDLDELTNREFEVLELAAKGLTNRDIAQILSISVRTVQVHLSNVFSKLGVRSRVEAILHALRQGWVTLDTKK